MRIHARVIEKKDYILKILYNTKKMNKMTTKLT